MPVDLYTPCVNPVTGETFRTISFEPEAFIMQWTVLPGGYVPFEHIHLNQDEVFHIKKGEMRVVINGKEIIGKAGETLTVPAGAKHIAYNNREEILDCVVEYRPGLDHDTFMRCIIGLHEDRFYDKRGEISIPKMGYFLARMNAKCMARPTKIPPALFHTALYFFYLRGVLSGWSKLYKKYTA